MWKPSVLFIVLNLLSFTVSTAKTNLTLIGSSKTESRLGHHVNLGAGSGDIELVFPPESSVFQRDASGNAQILLEGTVRNVPYLEARVIAFSPYFGMDTEWVELPIDAGGHFSSTILVSTGWYQIEVRGIDEGNIIVETSRQPIGVGDNFVTAGQSNSANHGSTHQRPSDPRVLTLLSSGHWVAATDPQPRASGNGGSPWPPFADYLVDYTGAPVGIIAVGQGSTTVAHWETSLFDKLIAPALLDLKPYGIRAILWHQGESDSLSATTTASYAASLNALIAQSWRIWGVEIPWGIAVASYHPSATQANEINVAVGQQMVIDQNILSYKGANTNQYHLWDLLGDSVHFNNEGLTEHGKQWAKATIDYFNLLPCLGCEHP